MGKKSQLKKWVLKSVNNSRGVLYKSSFGPLIAKEDTEVLKHIQERATDLVKVLEDKTDEKQLRELEKRRLGNLSSLQFHL